MPRTCLFLRFWEYIDQESQCRRNGHGRRCIQRTVSCIFADAGRKEHAPIPVNARSTMRMIFSFTNPAPMDMHPSHVVSLPLYHSAGRPSLEHIKPLCGLRQQLALSSCCHSRNAPTPLRRATRFRSTKCFLPPQKRKRQLSPPLRHLSMAGTPHDSRTHAGTCCCSYSV